MDDNDIADKLEEIARYLKAEGSRETYSYTRAANAIYRADVIPANPAELDEVGPSLREDIETLRVRGSHPRLERLREKHPYLSNLTEIEGVGPRTAANIHEELGITTINDLREKSDRLTEVPGIGEKRAENICEQL